MSSTPRFAAIALCAMLSAPCFAQTNTDATNATKSDMKHAEKVDKSQAKADKKERKALNTHAQKKADRAQDKADREAAKAAPNQ